MTVETVVLIRTRNEEQWLGEVLVRIFRQTYRDFHIIIIDSGSTDRTLEIARRFPVTVHTIDGRSFSYPYALNYGMRHAAAARYAVIMSAHSLPISDTWLADGIETMKGHPNLAGIYGYLRPLPGSSFADQIVMEIAYFWWRLRHPKRLAVVKKRGLGVLGFTNAIVRKDLRQQRPFNEEYGSGGEDTEWADFFLRAGCRVMRDRKFTVLHSHNLGFLGWYRQLRHWLTTARPGPFKSLSYRKDNAHRSGL